MVANSPGATVVQGDVHVHGYTAADVHRIVGERVAQSRAEVERAHAAKVEALRKEIAALQGSEWDAESLKEVQAALSAGDFDRAEKQLEEMEERQLARKSVPAAQERVQILSLRTAAAMLNDNAEKARSHIEEAVAVIGSVDPGSELEFRNKSAMAMQEYGAKVGGHGIVEAIRLFRLNLEQLDREELPEAWAETQHNLGNALLQHGMRVAGGLACIDDGIAALRKALEVTRCEADPKDWVQTQISLSGALIAAARRRGGEEGIRELAEAVAMCSDAGTVATREADPEGWSGIQGNLVIALSAQGDRRGGEEGAEMLGKAVEACRGLLEMRTRRGNRLEWAEAQSNLAATLAQRARHVPKPEAVECLEYAVKASEAALEVRTRGRNPLAWART